MVPWTLSSSCSKRRWLEPREEESRVSELIVLVLPCTPSPPLITPQARRVLPLLSFLVCQIGSVHDSLLTCIYVLNSGWFFFSFEQRFIHFCTAKHSQLNPRCHGMMAAQFPVPFKISAQWLKVMLTRSVLLAFGIIKHWLRCVHIIPDSNMKWMVFSFCSLIS